MVLYSVNLRKLILFKSIFSSHLFIDPLLPLVDGPDVLGHVAFPGEHLLAVGAGDALHTAVLRLPHVYVPGRDRRGGKHEI